MGYIRPKGFFGCIPRDWVDKTLPVCPLCGENPNWHYRMKISWWETRYLFKCSNCNGVISALNTTVNKLVRAFNWAIIKFQKNLDKFKVEDVGVNNNLSSIVGNQYTKEDLLKINVNS